MPIDKKNIFLENVTESIGYRSSPRKISRHYPIRDSALVHAAFLKTQFEQCKQQDAEERSVAAIKYKNGTYLEFSGKAGYELATSSLENRKQEIRLLNVKTEDNEITQATVYVPDGKMSYFLNKVESYAMEKTPKGKPRNNDLISSIENVKIAVLENFWLDKPEYLPGDFAIRCEIWLRYEIRTRGKNIDLTPQKTIEKLFADSCYRLNIAVDSKGLYFPERVVKLITANREQLKELIMTVDYIAEIKRADEPNNFFLDSPVAEQQEWAQDVLDRTTYEKSGVSICILDAGMYSAHKLLKPAVDKCCVQAVRPEWGVDDNIESRGHGTEMAGVALYNDLKEKMIGNKHTVIPYQVESVKILPPHGDNERDLYGAITQQAVLLADIARPSRNRIICMAVTANDTYPNDGRPTSWSAALDSITSGAGEEDEKRLFLVSAGNVQPQELFNQSYPDANILHPVENPAQSWNAISVGAYCESVEITDLSFKGFQPVASNFQISPYSSTSLSWSDKWPIKPDVLFNGGNMVTNGSDFDSCSDLSLLTTGHQMTPGLFSTIWGTSSAAAQAANFCAYIENEYPDMWPETVRALMIHSADWTEEMKKQFCKDETKKGDRKNLLRACGYGIPDLNRSIQCMNNSVNMIIQAELQPYKKDSMNEMHLHTIPWPKEVLRDLGDAQVKLKVTLSYYIEPSPGEVGWKERYRYSSCGLRFDVNNKNQTCEDFKRSIDALMRQDEDNKSSEKNRGSSRWYLGKCRDCGSIHSDFMIENAVDLCECRYIAVYPVGGWWRERKYLRKYDSKVRYSLVVSISTPENDVNLYTPIMSLIKNPIEVSISGKYKQ